MQLENIVMQARDPAGTGRFWAEALNLETLTETPDLVEGRLRVGPAWLDLCVERVAEPAPGARLHLDLHPGDSQAATVSRLLDLGARHLDIGQGEVSWVVLADPEGTAFCVLGDHNRAAPTGPILALPLDSAAPERDAEFWRLATGWTDVASEAPVALQHPSGHGPHLELWPEPEPTRGQNRIHLDTRPSAAETRDACVDRLLAAGGVRVDHDWGDLPWTVLRDPSGNELCVLEPAST